MEGERALEDMERQMEVFPDAIALKLYPNSWLGEEFSAWHMDDPEIAYPVFQKALDLGLNVVAIHKAVPLGPVPMEHYKMDDIDRAAMDFPNINFEVIHGGMAFLEETAWQVARFENVYVNLEITTGLAAMRPKAFAQAMAALSDADPVRAANRIMWGTGAIMNHPQPHLEAFVREFEFGPDVLADGIPQWDAEVKRKVLWENYARMTGLDLDARLERIKDDEFSVRRAEGRPAPYSTTRVAGRAF
jgi:predicted TIM-barrel fold metal-dependent hydrolase